MCYLRVYVFSVTSTSHSPPLPFCGFGSVCVYVEVKGQFSLLLLGSHLSCTVFYIFCYFMCFACIYVRPSNVCLVPKVPRRC